MTKPVQGSTSAGAYCSSSALIYESVAGAGSHTVHSFARTFVATSIDLKLVATIVPAFNINTFPQRISYVSALVGVKVKGLSSVRVGVVPPVFPIINRSSTFPADFHMIRTLYP